MDRPQPGLALPVVFRRCRDADTVEVSVPGSAIKWAVRLLDCRAPELHRGDQREIAEAGRAWLEKYLRDADQNDLLLFVPLPDDGNPLHALTFDRVLGYLWVGNVLVNSLIVANGFASSTKDGPLGQ